MFELALKVASVIGPFIAVGFLFVVLTGGVIVILIYADHAGDHGADPTDMRGG